jgi:serine/threonine protein kinase
VTLLTGAGNTGTVYKALYNGQVVAVKQLKEMESEKRDVFEKELSIYRKMERHVNIVSFLGYTSQPLCLVIEFV